MIDGLKEIEKKYPVLQLEDKLVLQMAAQMIETEDFEKVYHIGYEHGYQQAFKDVIKKLREMSWHGGGYKEKCAAGVSEHHASGAGRDEQKL